MTYANGQDSTKTQLSALADGELDIAQAQALVSASHADDGLAQAWGSYMPLEMDCAPTPVKITPAMRSLRCQAGGCAGTGVDGAHR